MLQFPVVHFFIVYYLLFLSLNDDEKCKQTKVLQGNYLHIKYTLNLEIFNGQNISAVFVTPKKLKTPKII